MWSNRIKTKFDWKGGAFMKVKYAREDSGAIDGKVLINDEL